IVSPEVPARSSKEGRPRSQNQDKQRIMLARDGGARRAPTDLCMMVIGLYGVPNGCPSQRRHRTSPISHGA
ncbi:hypothetical protein PF005_g28319, partial [Phytophthora fragariae]